MITTVNMINFLEVAKGYKFSYELKEVSYFESIYLFTNSKKELEYVMLKSRLKIK